MKVSEMMTALSLECTAGKGGTDNVISGCYIGDLLSLAMANVTEGTLWITIQTNINITAVASLADASCIIIADGFKPDDATVAKADELDIPVFVTEKSAYDLAKELASLGV